MQEPVSPAPAGRSSGPPLPAILTIGGGLIAVVGSFLPWAKVSVNLSQFGAANFSESVGGLEADGWFTLIAGLVLIAIGIAAYRKMASSGTALGVIGIIAGLAAAGTAIYDITSIESATTDDFANAASGTAGASAEQLRQFIEQLDLQVSLQIGIILAAIGGLAGLVGAVMILMRRSSSTPALDSAGVAAPPAPPFMSPAPPPPPVETEGAPGEERPPPP
jgi:hypothetical protein